MIALKLLQINLKLTAFGCFEIDFGVIRMVGNYGE
jgi:hypothetical protein